MIKFGELVTSVNNYYKGFTDSRIGDAINEAMIEFAKDNEPDFLRKEYFVNLVNGKSFLYTDSTFATRAYYLKPISHPHRKNSSGLIDSSYNRIRFYIDGEGYINIDPDQGYDDASYSFWCIKKPISVVLGKIELDNTDKPINYLDMESEFPESVKKSLTYYICHFLAMYKNDVNSAKMFLDLYKTSVKDDMATIHGDFGFRNSGDTSTDDGGSELEWV